MEVQITYIVKNILRDGGLTWKYLGYGYILAAIDLIQQNEHVLNNVCKVLYVDIAKQFETTPEAVERNMRHAIHVLCNNGAFGSDLFFKIFGVIEYVPSNKMFLRSIYEYAKYEYLISAHS